MSVLIGVVIGVLIAVPLTGVTVYAYMADDELETTELSPNEYRVKVDARLDHTEELVDYVKQKIRSKGLHRHNNSQILVKSVLLKKDDEFDFEKDGEVPDSLYVRYEIGGREDVIEI